MRFASKIGAAAIGSASTSRSVCDRITSAPCRTRAVWQCRRDAVDAIIPAIFRTRWVFSPRILSGCLQFQRAFSCFVFAQGCIYKFTDELRDHLNILAAVGSGICVVQIFGLVLSCCLYIKLKDVGDASLWHKATATGDPTGDLFAEDPLADGVSLIYGGHNASDTTDHCPVHRPTATTNGNGRHSRYQPDTTSIDGIYPMDVPLWGVFLLFSSACFCRKAPNPPMWYVLIIIIYLMSGSIPNGFLLLTIVNIWNCVTFNTQPQNNECHSVLCTCNRFYICYITCTFIFFATIVFGQFYTKYA